MTPTDYHLIFVESFFPADTNGRHGALHIRPVPGQPLFPETLFVECSRSLVKNHPVGTVFRIRGKLSLMKGTPYIYSHYSWSYQVVE